MAARGLNSTDRQLNYVKNHQVTLLIRRFLFMRIYKYGHYFIQDVTQNSNLITFK
jgi:hypothetical protein